MQRVMPRTFAGKVPWWNGMGWLPGLIRLKTGSPEAPPALLLLPPPETFVGTSESRPVCNAGTGRYPPWKEV